MSVSGPFSELFAKHVLPAGVACYMPKAGATAILPDISHADFISLRRGLLSRTLKLLEPLMLGDVQPSFDDGLTAFMLTSIGPSENDTESRLSHWLSFLSLTIRTLGINAETEGIDEEEKEERRRHVKS